MIEFTKELVTAMKQFKEKFGDIVPLNEIPNSTSTSELLKAINSSIAQGRNLLPSIFGYGKEDGRRNKII